MKIVGMLAVVLILSSLTSLAYISTICSRLVANIVWDDKQSSWYKKEKQFYKFKGNIERIDNGETRREKR